MRKFLVYAKHLAMQDYSKSIELNHLKEAFLTCHFALQKDSTKLATAFKEALGIKRISSKKISFREYIINSIEALNEEKIQYSNEVKEVLETLKVASFDIENYDVLFVVDDFQIQTTRNIEEYYNVYFEDELENFFSKPVDPIERANEAEKYLSTKIFGQGRVIEAIGDAIKSDIFTEPNKPRQIFFFIGPSATGKSEMGKELINAIEGYDSYKIFNMTQYTHDESGGNLYGTARQWSNTKPGQLTSFVRKNPKSIIVFDDFDKCHNNIQNNLLSILSDGLIDDACGWCQDGKPFHSERAHEDICSDEKIKSEIDFTQTILVFTSNLGSELYNNHEFLECLDTDPLRAQSMIFDALKREKKNKFNSADEINKNESDEPAILPSFLSRLAQGTIVLFDKLKLIDITAIVNIQFEKFKTIMLSRYKIDIKISDENLKYFLNSMVLRLAPNVDTRNAKAKLMPYVFDTIIDELERLNISIDTIKKIEIKVSNTTKKYFDANLKELIDNDKILKHFFRKNYSLKLNLSIQIKKDHLVYEIADVNQEKVKSINDFIGEDKFLFEVPESGFNSIAGHDNAKMRLLEVIKYIKNPKLLEDFGITTPRGMLMYGPPGTGKTMLAKAFANEADLPFIETTGAKILDIDHLKTIYKKAKDYAPAIIFIDEIDAIGSRGFGGNDIVINQFLTELNGFSDNPDELIFTIAATNLKEKIDQAILRSGRIDLHVEISHLDSKAREFMLSKLLKKPNDGSLDINKLIMYSAGMSGADLEKILRESSLEVIRRGKDKLSQEIVLEQINILKYGNRISGRSIEMLIGETAYHEAGHAVISKVLNPKVKIEQITVAAREDTLGFVSYNMEDSASNPSKKDLQNQICVAYAGRIAQMKQFGETGLDSGASSDLAHATKIAMYMVAKLGMDDEIGYINTDGVKNTCQAFRMEYSKSDFMQETIEQRVKINLDGLKITTEQLVDANWSHIEALAQLLIKQEVVHEEEINALMDIKK